MIITTTDQIPNQDIQDILGIVKGNSVRARNLGRDAVALLKNVVGGELDEYTKLLYQSREQAMERLIEEAKNLNADAVINIRFSTAVVVQAASEILVYGTAVKLKSINNND
ncbi:YbjQ family protein [uncultured Tenacibaculum sp.]|uniref:YbjQ family protein n=1 Tax=uncultured Tenacibaculum sp. TaxID=174713 RepID=UPI002613D6E5|nr:YbjQ family protein [uncultured Tenacibaculum sp.]